jgi:hypothetical protein
MFVMSVVCVVQRRLTDCGASYAMWSPEEGGGHGLCWAAAPQKNVRKEIIYLNDDT